MNDVNEFASSADAEPLPAQEPISAPEPAPEQHAGIPDEIKQLREQDADRKMFGAQSMLGDIPIEEAFAEVDVPDEVKSAAAAEFREIATDVGLSSPEAKMVLSEFRAALASPPTLEARAAGVAEAQRQLAAKYGEDVPQVLADARALVARDPRVAQLLERSGLGDDPKMIMRMAELGRRARIAGKLK